MITKICNIYVIKYISTYSYRSIYLGINWLSVVTWKTCGSITCNCTYNSWCIYFSNSMITCICKIYITITIYTYSSWFVQFCITRICSSTISRISTSTITGISTYNSRSINFSNYMITWFDKIYITIIITAYPIWRI